MKNIFILGFLSLVVLTNSSCLKDDGPEYTFAPLLIKSVDLPESFNLNETYRVSVTYDKPKTCTEFWDFSFTRNELTTRTVAVIGTEPLDVNTCTEAVTEETKTFNFKVIYNQTYQFKFYSGRDEDGNATFIEMEVPIAE